MNETTTENLDRITVGVSKLQPVKGDIIVVRVPEELEYEQIQNVAAYIGSALPEGVVAMVLTSAMEVSMLDEDSMNALGWQKIQRH